MVPDTSITDCKVTYVEHSSGSESNNEFNVNRLDMSAHTVLRGTV